ncbi:MAG: PfkB family carbohydrate kinase [Planctomycetia bacterium]|nr:PfkB family carbohydrate kinase [Planctomycetia bacterium]
MSRILTLGLTPSWQHVLEFIHLKCGEVNRATASHWFSAGKSVNVALAIHTLGGDVHTILPGGGQNRLKMEEDFQNLQLSHQWLETQSEIRVCTTLIDHATQTITELVENGTPLTDSEIAAWLALCEETFPRFDVFVLSGSLPGGVEESLYEKMMAKIPAGKPAILDFRGKGLLDCLKYRPFLVKPNREELEMTFQTKLTTEETLLDACHDLNRQGAEWVVLSDGPGKLYAVSEKETHCFRPPQVTPPEGKTLCPIGCGDALTGGIALALAEGKSLPAAVEFGMEIAVRNLFQVTSCRF